MTNVLYSFRRCPYAMRARLAIASAGKQVELREVVLRDKPQAFLDVSPSGTVPCLVFPDTVPSPALDESLDIMVWAVGQNDPEGWLEMPDAGFDWISRCDGPFKQALDRTKYGSRYPEQDPTVHRAKAAVFLNDLNAQIDSWIFEKPSLADYAILPFVRQFAFIDKTWFDTQPWPDLQSWLNHFLTSERFENIMQKYPQWQASDTTIHFP